MSKVGYKQNNDRIEVGIGLGSVNTFAVEMGHEVIWNKLGLDISLKGERNKQLLKNIESKDVQLADGSEVEITNQYRPSDIRFGLGAEATYRPNKAKRAKHIGVRARMATAGGRKVLSSRRAKGRHELIRA